MDEVIHALEAIYSEEGNTHDGHGTTDDTDASCTMFFLLAK